MGKQLLLKRVLNLAYMQGILYERSKDPDKFRASKIFKSVRKVSKTQNCTEF